MDNLNKTKQIHKCEKFKSNVPTTKKDLPSPVHQLNTGEKKHDPNQEKMVNKYEYLFDNLSESSYNNQQDMINEPDDFLNQENNVVGIAIDYFRMNPKNNEDVKYKLLEVQSLPACNNHDHDSDKKQEQIDICRKREEKIGNLFSKGVVDYLDKNINSNKGVQRILFNTSPVTKKYNPDHIITLHRDQGCDFSDNELEKLKLFFQRGNFVIKGAGCRGDSNMFVRKTGATQLEIKYCGFKPLEDITMNKNGEEVKVIYDYEAITPPITVIIDANTGFEPFIATLKTWIKKNDEMNQISGNSLSLTLAIEDLIQGKDDQYYTKNSQLNPNQIPNDDLRNTTTYKRVIALRNNETNEYKIINVYKTILKNSEKYGTDNHAGDFVHDKIYCEDTSNQILRTPSTNLREFLKDIFTRLDDYHNYKSTYNPNYQLPKYYRGQIPVHKSDYTQNGQIGKNNNDICNKNKQSPILYNKLVKPQSGNSMQNNSEPGWLKYDEALYLANSDYQAILAEFQRCQPSNLATQSEPK